MSYDIKFLKDGKTCQIPFTPPAGGTYCADKDFHDAWINITYNYSDIFYNHGLGIYYKKEYPESIKYLEGKLASEVVKILTRVIPTLGDDVDDDYWKPTEGNAKKALINLLTIAVAVPKDAICHTY